MPTRRALIVDDSRTAQQLLLKMLSAYPIEVDLTASAEEAMEYLKQGTPVAIFMDHHMEGMDGLEALRIIKGNPRTANIPIVMYTSKSDDVYIGQAQALGAIDTLSKSYMKASRIEEVLAKLNIHRADVSIADSSEDTVQVNPSELKSHIARLFELHLAEVSTQIDENRKFIVRRLGDDIHKITDKDTHHQDLPLSVISDEIKAESSRLGLASNSLLLLILVALTAVSYQLYTSQQNISALEENYILLLDLGIQQNLLLDDIVTAPRVVSAALPGPQTILQDNANQLNPMILLNTITWASGVDFHFGFEQDALGEPQVIHLQYLTHQLEKAGFRGTIKLKIHLGNFCLSQKDGDIWQLANEEAPAAECDFTEHQRENPSLEDFTSVAYVEFEQSSLPIKRGEIKIAVDLRAYDTPTFPYPTTIGTATAGDWNEIAARNQRITLSLDTTDYPEKTGT